MLEIEWHEDVFALWLGRPEYSQWMSYARRKRRLIMGYELFDTTGSFHAEPSCLLWAYEFGQFRSGLF